VLVYL